MVLCIEVRPIGVIRHRDACRLDIDNGVAHRAGILAVHANAQVFFAGPLMAVKRDLLIDIGGRIIAKPIIKQRAAWPFDRMITQSRRCKHHRLKPPRVYDDTFGRLGTPPKQDRFTITRNEAERHHPITFNPREALDDLMDGLRIQQLRDHTAPAAISPGRRLGQVVVQQRQREAMLIDADPCTVGRRIDRHERLHPGEFALLRGQSRSAAVLFVTAGCHTKRIG